MSKKCCPLDREIPISELKQQIEYTRTVGSDLFKIFMPEEPDAETLVAEYAAIRNRLSMMLDFLFQASLWCDTLK